MSDHINEPMLEMYLFETVQLVNRLEQLIMTGEKDEDFDAAIDEIFRIMHTIKGNSMMMLFEGIAEIAHKLEDLFDYIRKNQDTKPNYETITDLVLETIDFIKGEITKIESNEKVDGDPTDLTESILEYLESLKFMNSSSETEGYEEVKLIDKDQKYFIRPSNEDELGQNSQETSKDTKNKNFTNFEVFIKFEQGCEMENVRAFSIIHNLQDIGSEIYHIPKNIIEDENAAKYISENGFRLIFKSQRLLDELNMHFAGIAFLDRYDVREIDARRFEEFVNHYINFKIEQDETRENMEADEVISRYKDKDEVDQLVIDLSDDNHVDDLKDSEQEEEVHIKKSDMHTDISENPPDTNIEKEDISASEAKAQKKKKAEAPPSTTQSSTLNNYISVGISKVDLLMDLIGELVVSESMVTKNPDLRGLDLENFEKASRQLRIIINELQDLVMSIRMVPLTLTFQKMSRIVRDMSKKVNKEVELKLIGEDTEVDKKVIEKISDPLMHIIRNSMDHGIEPEDVRIANNKSKKGTIVLEAKHSGGDVWIIVRDDGGGLDREKILEKAISRNILEKNADEYTDKEVYGLIFKPGFSTKEKVTEFSGRGVGLDVVVRNVEELGGTILVDSKLGEWTEFAIRIPLTLAIVDGMMMQVGKSIFTVPITSIKESFSVTKKDVIVDPDGNEMIMVRGECLPVLRLHRRYQLNTEIEDLEEGILMMIEGDNKTNLIFADSIIGEQQVVVKGLSKFMNKINGISGCALLGDGTISLIIDPAGLSA